MQVDITAKIISVRHGTFQNEQTKEWIPFGSVMSLDGFACDDGFCGLKTPKTKIVPVQGSGKTADQIGSSIHADMMRLSDGGKNLPVEMKLKGGFVIETKTDARGNKTEQQVLVINDYLPIK